MHVAGDLVAAGISCAARCPGHGVLPVFGSVLPGTWGLWLSRAVLSTEQPLRRRAGQAGLDEQRDDLG